MQRVSVIVPCWNQLRYTTLCSAGLHYTTYPHEVIWINNGSRDGTREFLDGEASRHCGDQVIHNESNRGYPVACNQGASKSKEAYLCFLNNDVRLQPGWLGALMHAMEFSDLTGPWLVHRWIIRDIVISYLEGACLLVKQQVFRDLGGFDEAYSPCYWEDADLCVAAQTCGYHMTAAPAAIPLIHHFASKTAQTQRDFSIRQVAERNKSYFCRKWQRLGFRSEPEGAES